jgi:hypothetical protein
MQQLQCGICGGVIPDGAKVARRVATRIVGMPAPHGGNCRCRRPIVNEPPVGFASMPAMPRVERPVQALSAIAGRRSRSP